MSDQDKAAVWKENVEALHRAQRANLLQRERIEQLEAALRESVKAMEYAKGYLDVPGSFNPVNNHPATVLYNAIGPARALIGEA